MLWDIQDKVRAHIVGFSGINFSGERWEADIWPHGGLQSGTKLDGRRLKSIGIIAPVGVRMILKTTTSEHWQELPWRCVQVVEGFTFESKGGKPGVQIPDLDAMDAPGSLRTDPDHQVGYPSVESLDAGTGWTFGHCGGLELKCNIRAIRVERPRR